MRGSGVKCMCPFLAEQTGERKFREDLLGRKGLLQLLQRLGLDESYSRQFCSLDGSPFQGCKMTPASLGNNTMEGDVGLACLHKILLES